MGAENKDEVVVFGQPDGSRQTRRRVTCSGCGAKWLSEPLADLSAALPSLDRSWAARHGKNCTTKPPAHG